MTAPGEFFDTGAGLRCQWMTFEDAPEWYTAHFQTGIPKQRLSLGGAIVFERSGPEDNRSVSITAAYRIPLKRDAFLSVGLLGGIYRTELNPTNFRANQINDPLFSATSTAATAPNLGAGFYFVSNTDFLDQRNKGFFVGLGIQQSFPNHRDLYLTNEPHFNASIGGGIELGPIFGECSIWMDYTPTNLFYGTLATRFYLGRVWWIGGTIGQDYTFGLSLGCLLINKLGDGDIRLTGRAYSPGRGKRWSTFGPTGEVAVAYQFAY